MAFDQRGHGESEGALDARLLDGRRDDGGAAAAGPGRAARLEHGRLLALLAAGRLRAGGRRRDLPGRRRATAARACAAGRFEFRVRRRLRSRRFLLEHDSQAAVADSDARLLLLHAEGDEQVPVERSRALHAPRAARAAGFIALPGGHHRSIQHDAELQGESLRFVEKAFYG